MASPTAFSRPLSSSILLHNDTKRFVIVHLHSDASNTVMSEIRFMSKTCHQTFSLFRSASTGPATWRIRVFSTAPLEEPQKMVEGEEFTRNKWTGKRTRILSRAATATATSPPSSVNTEEVSKKISTSSSVAVERPKWNKPVLRPTVARETVHFSKTQSPSPISLKTSTHPAPSPPLSSLSSSQSTTTVPREDGIERLRAAFLQSMQLDREKRLKAATHSTAAPSPTTNTATNAQTHPSKTSMPRSTAQSSSPNKFHNNSSSTTRIVPSSSTSPFYRNTLHSLEDTNNEDGGKYNYTDNNNNSMDSNSNNPNSTAWRHSGAKEFRDRRKMANRLREEQQQQQQGSPKSLASISSLDKFSELQKSPTFVHHDPTLAMNTKKLQQDLLQHNTLSSQQQGGGGSGGDKDGGDAKSKQVTLPQRKKLSLLDLSTLLRVKIPTLLETLSSLGEVVPVLKSSSSSPSRNRSRKRHSKATPIIKDIEPPSNPSSSSTLHHLADHEVDLDVAELMALELGIEVVRDSRKAFSRSMVRAEQRVMRQSSNSGDEESTSLPLMDEEILYQSLPPRPPVVCLMGHVDHGKTTLMDALRKKAREACMSSSGDESGASGGTKKKNSPLDVKSVAGTEAGGITQVVSAFQVPLPGISSSSASSTTTTSTSGMDFVTFLDTPGHAAFKAMRQSGSNCADVIVLVVAADDGISKQTLEIIDMFKTIARAQPGSISLVVALTKIDKPGIDVQESIQRVENQLMQCEIYTESVSVSDVEFGGVQMIPVSGLTGQGVNDLIEAVALQSEIMNLRADQDTRAEGLVVDARVENGLGVVAECIIRWGKLEKGDYLVSGLCDGKVRILTDVNNKPVTKALPSQPVRIIGLRSLPQAGDPIVCVQSEEIAKEIVLRRQNIKAAQEGLTSYRADQSNTNPLKVELTGAASKHSTLTRKVLEKYGLNQEEPDPSKSHIRIPIVIKSDANGSLDAVRQSLVAISTESKHNLIVDPIEVSIGQLTISDVRLAAESGAAIFCFNLKGTKDKAAMSLAEAEGVRICSNNVIYHLLDEAKQVFSTYFPPVPTDKIHGTAVVQAVFDVNNKKDAERVAGLKVHEGLLFLEKSNKDSGSLPCEYRVKRGDEVISPNGLRAKSLRKVKEDVKEVRRGDDCGLCLGSYTDIKEGDVIECFSTEMKYTFI